MSISCSCGDDYEWMYHGPDDFEPLNTKRRRRCISCGTMIDVGADAGRFSCYHAPRGDYEEQRFGDEVPMADKWMCEECTGVYISLSELGYCVTIGDGMTMKENARMAGSGEI